MSNSYKPVSDILGEAPSLSGYLKNSHHYYAHTPRNASSNSTPETLSEHIELVNGYLQKLTGIHKLDKIINRLISSYLLEHNCKDQKVGEYAKLLFVNTIVFHDFGKINENFQAAENKMNNPHFKEKGIVDSPISTRHSSLGAFIYLGKHLNDIQRAFKGKDQGLLAMCCFILSYSIFKHHSRKLNDDYGYTICFSEDLKNIDTSEFKAFMKRYVDAYGIEVGPSVYKFLAEPELFQNNDYRKLITSFSLYALSKLNFSLLTASDYLATNQYMNGLPVDNIGILTNGRIEEIYDQLTQKKWLNQSEGKRNFNRQTYQDLENYTLRNPKEESGANLNILRKEMAIEVIENIRQNLNKNLFYIEAPTGGGKTNLSILATLELIKAHKGKYNKVFYVFPFTTLVTQTYKSIKETLDLREEEMVELHSKAGFKENQQDDALYGGEKLNYINNLFVNYPFSLLTHIRFFDILKTNEKELNYLLHRLANSIVVIDELQSYNPSHWDKVIYFIKEYAEKFNIKFILMSATLPKLDNLDVIKEMSLGFVYLLPEAKKNYFQNPNFCNRVTFNFELFERSDLKLEELSSRVISESETYSKQDFAEAKPKGSVYTIIEFIFKKSAGDFFKAIKDTGFFDEIFVLSGTIIEHRRKHIINFLKNKSNRKKKILLITTQVVEAGVDIDMDLGFKDSSLIDSDEQLAGRINRNVNKKGCQLFLFNYNKETIIYGKDKRLELTRKHINIENYREILQNKNFDKLYDLVLNDRNEWNNKEMTVGFNEYEQKIRTLKFQSVHEDFKLIEQDNISCFIPLGVPVKVNGVVNGQDEAVFSDIELKFLEQHSVYSNSNGDIEGEEVFDLYLDLIHKKQEFIKQKTNEKILQGIMSKYVFSLFASEKIKSQIIHFSDEEKSEYGYKYLEGWKNFYDVETGMRDSDFYSNETQFL